QAGEYKAALVSFAKALQVRPDYPPAHYQRAETLRAQGRYAAAGEALDAYLRKGPPTPEVYFFRGLIHLQVRAYPKAVAAFTCSPVLRKDADVLSYRGWTYLRLDAARLARADFEAALRRDKRHANAWCGLGLARVRLGQVAAGVADAEKALRYAPKKG